MKAVASRSRLFAASILSLALCAGLSACASTGTGVGPAAELPSTAAGSASPGGEESGGAAPRCEDNGSFACAEQASALGALEGQFGENAGRGPMARHDAPDFFRFELDSSGVLEIAIDPMPPEAQGGVAVYDSEQREVGSERVYRYGKSLFFAVPVRAGTYYVKARDYYESTGSYRMQVDLDIEDVYEVNNTFSGAKPIRVGEAIRAKMKPATDRDFFRVEVEEAGRYEVAVESVPAGATVGAAVYDPRQRRVARKRGRAEGKNLYVPFEAQRPGAYYLEVGRSGGPRGDFSDDFYELTVEHAGE